MKQTTSMRMLGAACAFACTSSPLLAQEQIEEVLVIGTPINRSPDDLAQSVSVLSGDELNRVRTANLGETLAGQLGVSASYFGAGSSRPIIRGLAGPRVRMMEDGIDSLDVSTVSADHAVSVDPLAAEQIEIFRGPTTLLYGSGAVGGVVNTVTNRIPELAPEDGFDAALELRGDSVSDGRALSLALDGGGSSLAWHLDAHTQDTDDYEIPGFAELEAHHEEEEAEAEAVEEEHHEEAFGILENSDVEVDSIAGGLSWLGESGFFGVSVSSYTTNYGLPGHDHAHEEEEVAAEEEHAEAGPRIDLDQSRVDLKGGWASLGGAIQAVNLRLGVSDYEHVELEGDEVEVRFLNDAYEGRIEVMHSPWGEWNGAFGLQLTNRDYSAVGGDGLVAEEFVPPTETTSYGLFMIEQRELERWQLSLGARIESQEHVPTRGAPRVDGTASSVSLAAIRELGSGYSLAFNTAIAERLPVADELYANGPHHATGTVEIGDPNLGVETSRHIDLGIRKSEGDLTWAVTAFATDYADYIYLRDTGLVDEELPVFAYSQADAEFAGVEAELFTPIADLGNGHIDLRLYADYVEGELDSGEHLPRLPPRRAGARIQYHNDGWIAGLEATRYDDQNKIGPLEEPTAGYTMLNADLQWTIGRDRSAQYEIFVRGTNLLDEDARRHTSFLKEVAPLPGRNYSVGFRVNL